MTDIAKLKELRERVIAATGPDRRLDYEIFSFFAEKERANIWDPKEGSKFTASSGAAGMLIERMLPGCFLSVSYPSAVGESFMACIAIYASMRGAVAGFAATKPLAILAAMLSALIAQAERAGE